MSVVHRLHYARARQTSLYLTVTEARALADTLTAVVARLEAAEAAELENGLSAADSAAAEGAAARAQAFRAALVIARSALTPTVATE